MAKPGHVQLIGILMVISGCINILVGLGITLSIILGTLGIGLLCAPIFLIPVGVGIYEIIVGANVLGDKPAKGLQVAAGLEIASILWGNVISCIAGILVFVLRNDPETRAYLESKL